MSMALLLLILSRMEMDAQNKTHFWDRNAGLLELVGRTRRATDAAIPELNINGSTSFDF